MYVCVLYPCVHGHTIWPSEYTGLPVKANMQICKENLDTTFITTRHSGGPSEVQYQPPQKAAGTAPNNQHSYMHTHNKL